MRTAPLKSLFIMTFMFITSCASATLTEVNRGDLEEPFGFRGGTFSYLNQGADFVIESRFMDGLEQANQVCGSSKVVIVDTSDKSYNGTMLLPYQDTTQHNGTISSGLDTYRYKAISTQNTYQTYNYTSNYKRIHFKCADPDVDENVYSLSAPDQNSPLVCTELRANDTPGKQRLAKIANNSASDNCADSQGWIRAFVPSQSMKIHLFVGPKGKELCNNLETEMIEKEIPLDSTNLFLRKRLKCEQNLAH